MKRIIALITLFVCLLCQTSCSSNSTNSSSEEQSSKTEASSSVAPPASSQPSSSEASQSTSSKNEISQPQSSVPPQNDNPPTETIPILDGANFYTNDAGGASTIRVEGLGMFSLTYDQANRLYGNMSFAGLEATDKDYKMDMYGQGESIVFIHPNFSHELRLDKATGVAMYQTGGKVYYYTFPDYEYTSILDFVMRAYNEVEASLPEVETDENGNINVVTG